MIQTLAAHWEPGPCAPLHNGFLAICKLHEVPGCAQEEGRGRAGRGCCSGGAVLRCCACAACWLVFLGILVGLLVYLYLVKLPGVQCPL